MSGTIGIIDYEAGNVGSIANMLSRLGVKSRILTTGDDLDLVDKIVLPGVGHFDHGVDELTKRGFFERLVEHDGTRQPLLGICLGMQLLMSGSEEGQRSGLGLIEGECRRFDAKGTSAKVPHMGWNRVSWEPGAADRVGAQGDDRYYFVHSYWVAPSDPARVLGRTHHIDDFCSAVSSGTGVTGFQFHPEKSHRFGMALLDHFASAPC